MDIKTELDLLMKRYNLVDYGVMNFDEIQTLIECRAMKRLPKNPRCVISCIFPYYTSEFADRNVSLYSVVPDYHTYINNTLGKICNELSNLYNYSYVHFSDISPIPEVFCAVKAGLGFRGKNNLLITKKYGSYVFIGEIVTDMPLDISTPNEESCLNCGNCEKACPNFAIKTDLIDYTKCVSQISQRKGELSEDEKAAIKRCGLAWGCDRCQEICPHNNKVKKTNISEFLSDTEPFLTLENIDSLIKTRAYGYKGKPLLKRNLSLFN